MELGIFIMKDAKSLFCKKAIHFNTTVSTALLIALMSVKTLVMLGYIWENIHA